MNAEATFCDSLTHCDNFATNVEAPRSFDNDTDNGKFNGNFLMIEAMPPESTWDNWMTFQGLMRFVPEEF